RTVGLMNRPPRGAQSRDPWPEARRRGARHLPRGLIMPMITTTPIGDREFAGRLLLLWKNAPEVGRLSASDVPAGEFVDDLALCIDQQHVTHTFVELQEMGFVIPERPFPGDPTKRPPQCFRAQYWQTIAKVLRLDPASTTIKALSDAAGDAYRW